MHPKVGYLITYVITTANTNLCVLSFAYVWHVLLQMQFENYNL